MSSVTRPYQKHFQNFVNKHRLFKADSKLIVSFSGGVDSVALVDLLCATGFGQQIELVHFNHQNRDGNLADETFVKDFAKNNSLKYKIIKLKGLKKQDFENQARKKRYNSLLAIDSSSPILMGHHIDDSFEWHLMQSFKSSSLKSSIGIPLVSGRIVRPLMCFSKLQILNYAKLKNLKFVNDPTNDQNNHERNYVRNVLIPKIKQKYPSYLKNYVARARALALKFNSLHLKQREFQVEKSKSFSEIYSFDHEGEFDQLDLLITEEVKRLSSKSRGSLRGQLEKIKLALKNNKLGPITLSGGLKVYCSYNHLFIGAKSPEYRNLGIHLAYSLDHFGRLLSEQKTFFGVFIEVKNLRFNNIKRSYPFTDKSKGKITPIDLLRQWSKSQNKNKKLTLVF